MNNTPRRPWLASFRRKIHATVVSTKCLAQREGSHLHCSRIGERPCIRWGRAAIRKVAPAADSYGIRFGEGVDGREPMLIRTCQSWNSQEVPFSPTRKITPSLVPSESCQVVDALYNLNTHHQDPTLCCSPQAGYMP